MRNSSVKLFLNLDQWTSGCRVFLLLGSGNPFVQLSGTICAREYYEEIIELGHVV